MKIVVRRTSDFCDENKPCEEAIKIIVPHWSTRTCTEKQFNESVSHREGLWRSKGKNHKNILSDDGLNETWITRQEDDREVWGVKIGSLSELLKFIDKYGECVLSQYEYAGDENIYELEIYDSYRE